MEVSGSGFVEPSDVVEGVLELSDGDCGFEACGCLDAVFANEWVIESGAVVGYEGMFHCSGFCCSELYGDNYGGEPVVVEVVVPPSQC